MKACILLVFSACITGAWTSDGSARYACRQRLMESEELSNTRTIHLPWDEFDVDRVSYFDRFSKVLLDRGTLMGFQDELLKTPTEWKGVIDSAGHRVTHNITIDGLAVNFRAFVTHSKFPIIGKAASALGLAWTDTHVLTMTVKKLTAQETNAPCPYPCGTWRRKSGCIPKWTLPKNARKSLLQSSRNVSQTLLREP
uniref:Putative secreted protein n=1 Tax=Ixodes ricinus TaxID=34613 RepID=V5IC83_IXORI